MSSNYTKFQIKRKSGVRNKKGKNSCNTKNLPIFVINGVLVHVRPL